MLTYPKSGKANAERRSSELLAKYPEIKQEVALILDRQGMSKERACKKLKRLWNAKKQVVVDKTLQAVPDNPTQLESVKTVLKLHGELKTGVNITEDNRQINIGQEEIDHRQLKTLTHKLSQLHRLMTKQDPGEQTGDVVDADFSTTDDTVGVEDVVFEAGADEPDTTQMSGADVSRGTPEPTQLCGNDQPETESGDGGGGFEF